MASITVEIPDALKAVIERKARAGKHKTSSAYVQMLIAESVRNLWKEEADAKLRESLREFERGEGVVWKMGDCEKMVLEYLKKKNVGKRKKS